MELPPLDAVVSLVEGCYFGARSASRRRGFSLAHGCGLHQMLVEQFTSSLRLRVVSRGVRANGLVATTDHVRVCAGFGARRDCVTGTLLSGKKEVDGQQGESNTQKENDAPYDEANRMA